MFSKGDILTSLSVEATIDNDIKCQVIKGYLRESLSKISMYGGFTLFIHDKSLDELNLETLKLTFHIEYEKEEVEDKEFEFYIVDVISNYPLIDNDSNKYLDGSMVHVIVVNKYLHDLYFNNDFYVYEDISYTDIIKDIIVKNNLEIGFVDDYDNYVKKNYPLYKFKNQNSLEFLNYLRKTAFNTDYNISIMYLKNKEFYFHRINKGKDIYDTINIYISPIGDLKNDKRKEYIQNHLNIYLDNIKDINIKINNNKLSYLSSNLLANINNFYKIEKEDLLANYENINKTNIIKLNDENLFEIENEDIAGNYLSATISSQDDNIDKIGELLFEPLKDNIGIINFKIDVVGYFEYNLGQLANLTILNPEKKNEIEKYEGYYLLSNIEHNFDFTKPVNNFITRLSFVTDSHKSG